LAALLTLAPTPALVLAAAAAEEEEEGEGLVGEAAGDSSPLAPARRAEHLKRPKVRALHLGTNPHQSLRRPARADAEAKRKAHATGRARKAAGGNDPIGPCTTRPRPEGHRIRGFGTTRPCSQRRFTLHYFRAALVTQQRRESQRVAAAACRGRCKKNVPPPSESS
jgi:hypothetical protein